MRNMHDIACHQLLFLAAFDRIATGFARVSLLFGIHDFAADNQRCCAGFNNEIIVHVIVNFGDAVRLTMTDGDVAGAVIGELHARRFIRSRHFCA